MLLALATGGCADPRTGRIDLARSTLLGIGAGAATFGVGSAILRDQQYRGRRGTGFGGWGQGSWGQRGWGQGHGPNAWGGGGFVPGYGPGHGFGRGQGW